MHNLLLQSPGCIKLKMVTFKKHIHTFIYIYIPTKELYRKDFYLNTEKLIECHSIYSIFRYECMQIFLTTKQKLKIYKNN